MDFKEKSNTTKISALPSISLLNAARAVSPPLTALREAKAQSYRDLMVNLIRPGNNYFFLIEYLCGLVVTFLLVLLLDCSVCVCIRGHTRVCEGAHMYSHIWKPDLKAKFLLLSLST